MDTQRIPTTSDISAIVQEVYQVWLSGGGAPNVTCPFDINTGPCGEFADEVVELATERFPGIDIEVEDFEKHLNDEGLTSQSIHYYVRFGDTYFDASCQEGVPSPDYLPTCRSMRICAAPLDGPDDIEDDEEDQVLAP